MRILPCLVRREDIINVYDAIFKVVDLLLPSPFISFDNV